MIGGIGKNSLADEVTAFRRSSIFTPGDPYSFSVHFGDLVLPGKWDPSSYLSFSPSITGRVAVLCPGNGGLCAELLRRGVTNLVAFEPRNQYFKSIAAVNGFVAAATGKGFSVVTRAPNATDGTFDTIFWPEGLEDIRDPAKLLRSVVEHLAPAGELYIEVHHGSHGNLPESINAWRPTPPAFEASVAKLGNVSIVRKSPGRNKMRDIYAIKDLRAPAEELVETPKEQPELVITPHETAVGPISTDAEPIDDKLDAEKAPDDSTITPRRRRQRK